MVSGDNTPGRGAGAKLIRKDSAFSSGSASFRKVIPKKSEFGLNTEENDYDDDIILTEDKFKKLKEQEEAKKLQDRLEKTDSKEYKEEEKEE